MIQIGSNSSALRNVISAHYAEHLLSSDNYYLMVSFPAESLPDDLSAVLLERLLPKMLLNAIAESEANIPEEQEYLADAVSDELLKNGSSESFRNSVTSAVSQLLREGNIVNIEGLLYFRLRDQLTEFYRSVVGIVRKFRSRYEKTHLLIKLRSYINSRPPQTDYIKVSGNASEYLLFDADGRTVRCVFSEEYTPEEHLLNSLLYLSPAVLDLSQLDHPELRDVLAEIFSDRIL